MNKQEWLEQKLKDFQKTTKNAIDEVMTAWYADYLPYLEIDYDENVRIKVEKELTAFLEDKSENHWCRDLTLTDYLGKDIRGKILEENKEELITLLNQDLLKQVEELKISLKNSYRNRY